MQQPPVSILNAETEFFVFRFRHKTMHR